MIIFNTYTGNAMLNNALMTIESLGKLKNVAEITPAVLLKLYETKDLLGLNKRLKSYTMLFTKNGPLHNDKVNGERVYDSLFRTILENFEHSGNKTCEISGLPFSTGFEKIFADALRKIGFPEKEIQKKDLTINRTWFPLIGGLGSDAQALPQAKFSVQIHPICVVILQFLPLSALLYNGGILLYDSSNFDLSRKFVRKCQQLLEEKINATSVTDQIENVRDFNKGHYILKTIELLEEKETYEETYSDLNLWSFSNSGTGASCSIDRVPNSLIRKLMRLDENSKTSKELKGILRNEFSFRSFLDDLEANNEWWLLYPAVFGSGKKEVRHQGVSVEFLEAYFEVTQQNQSTEYAQYIAGLIARYKTKSFDKYLSRTDAWKERDYRIDLYTILLAAAENGEWSLPHHIQILDAPDALPAKNNYYQYHKLIHFYYQKKHFRDQLPENPVPESNVLSACNWLISLINNDLNRSRTITDLKDRNNNPSVLYPGILLRSATNGESSIRKVATVLYDEDFKPASFGINELLRLYFSQSHREPATAESSAIAPRTFSEIDKQWFQAINGFSNEYRNYYYEKYKNRESGRLPVEKFKTLIKDISLETSGFLAWFREAITNTNEYSYNTSGVKDKWDEAELLTPPQQETALPFSKLAIKLALLNQSLINKTENTL